MRALVQAWISALRQRLNLWLLLAIFFCAGTALIVINAAVAFDLIRDHTTEVRTSARDAYEQGGRRLLQIMLRSVGAGFRVHLLDSGGRDLANGQYLSGLVAAAKPNRPVLEPPRSLLLRMDGYSCFIEYPSTPRFAMFGPISWVLPFVSILCCSVGAYVTWRMRRIESVVRQFGSGKLAARVPSDSRDAIGSLSRAFNDMAEQIAFLLASHQRLCADMAHELRSPLARLLLALRDGGRGGHGSLLQAEREARRMSDLIDQLLEVARAEVDPAALDVELLDLESLLTEIYDHCSIEASERGCEIELILSEAGSAEADRELIRRAIENVLRNAIQHTPEHTRITLWSGGDDRNASITIRDWGPGVPDEALGGIFKPFYRVDPSRSRANGGGVGLGLSIAQRAVALHHGVIFAENCTPGLRVVIRLARRLQA